MKTFMEYVEREGYDVSHDIALAKAEFEKFLPEAIENKSKISGWRADSDEFAIRHLDNGVFSRNNGPCVIHQDGAFFYYNPESHRDDGPAIVYANNGQHKWYELGKIIYNSFTTIKIDNFNNASESWKRMFLGYYPSFIEELMKPSYELQSFVLEKRPDLLSKIKYLDHRLAEKYSSQTKSHKAGISL